LKINESEVAQIKRLSNSAWVLGISDSVLRSLDQRTLSKMMAGFLYMKSNGRPDKDFATYMAMKEIWSTATIGLNVMAAVIPAMLFDKEFRTLAIKSGMSKGSEIGAKAFQKKIAKTDIDEASENAKQKIKSKFGK
jgi:hypothetical protein